MKSWIAGVFCALMACTARAESDAVRNIAEASMLVTGWIEVAPDGSVHDYTIDRPEKLPPSVLGLIQKSIPGWKFHFAEHADAIQRAKMNLRIIARPIDEQHDSVAISGATFGNEGATATDHVTFKDRQPPKYPRTAVDARVNGTVFLLLRVGRQGQVEDAAVEQVNLGVYGRETQMAHFRSVLGNAALEAARKWTYNLPSTGSHVMDPYWYVRVPVAFNLHVMGTPHDTYGKWEPYIPGPRASIPWAKNDSRLSSSSDAIPEGGISQADASLQLTTALGGA